MIKLVATWYGRAFLDEAGVIWYGRLKALLSSYKRVSILLSHRVVVSYHLKTFCGCQDEIIFIAENAESRFVFMERTFMETAMPRDFYYQLLKNKTSHLFWKDIVTGKEACYVLRHSRWKPILCLVIITMKISKSSQPWKDYRWDFQIHN